MQRPPVRFAGYLSDGARRFAAAALAGVPLTVEIEALDQIYAPVAV
jgi:hypothetical protein